MQYQDSMYDIGWIRIKEIEKCAQKNVFFVHVCENLVAALIYLRHSGPSHIKNKIFLLSLTAPWEKKLASMAVDTAFFISTSSKMIRGDLPPSSRVTFLRLSEALDII